MSAWVVDTVHIDMLLAAAQKYQNYGPLTWYHGDERHSLTSQNRDAVGQMLLQTNQDSVNYRYSETEPAEKYTYRLPAVPPTPVEALKGIHCLNYQSCELPNWRQTEAYAFCEAFTATVINALPGYERAPWGWTA